MYYQIDPTVSDTVVGIICIQRILWDQCTLNEISLATEYCIPFLHKLQQMYLRWLSDNFKEVPVVIVVPIVPVVPVVPVVTDVPKHTPELHVSF